MRNELRITLGLLALGAATSVLVAWTASFLLDPYKSLLTKQRFLFTIKNEVVRDWSIEARPGVNVAILVATYPVTPERRDVYQSPWIKESFQPRWCLSGFLANADIDRSGSISYFGRKNSVEMYELYGWPCATNARRVERWVEMTPANRAVYFTQQVHAYNKFVPVTPIWRGLLLNSAFYAVVWSIPLVCLPWFIRWRRTRRGGCPDCGYDVTGLQEEGLDTCPECGLTLAPAEDIQPEPASPPTPAS